MQPVDVSTEASPEALPLCICAHAPRTEVVEVTTKDGLSALRPAWENLFADADGASPFNTWFWLATWWDLFGRGKALRVFVVREGPQVIGIAPFYQLALGVGPSCVRILMQLGRGNVLTERMELLIARGRRADVVAALADYFYRRRRQLWDFIIWTSVECAELPPGLARLVRVNDSTDYEERPLPASWEAFVQGLNKSMRDNIKYYPRLLAREGHQAEGHIAASPDTIDAALDEFLHLHEARSTLTGTRRHDNRFGAATHRAFLHRVAPVLTAAGMMRVGLLSVDGTTVAAQVTLEYAGILYIYYSGFDPEWRRYGVGMTVTADCIRDAMNRDVHTVNFLRGTGQFKQRWDTQNVPLARLTLVSDGPGIQSIYALFLLQQRLLARLTILKARHGVSPQNRVLRWVSRVLGQPVSEE